MEGIITFPDTVRRAVEKALSLRFGERINIAANAPNFGTSLVFRCTLLESTSSAAPKTVIVRLPRQGTARTGSVGLHYEQTALEYLAGIGGSHTPRFFAGGGAAGFVVTEDLGDQPSLLDLLLGKDREAARQGVLSFARGLGMLHAKTGGGSNGARADLPVAAPAIAENWRRLRDAVTQLELPAPHGVESDIENIACLLAETSGCLALSSGDCSVVNCKISSSGARFFDFEDACYRHAFLDAAVLRYPYPTGAPAWRLPGGVAVQLELAYRSELARTFPAALEDDHFERGMAAACAAWTILRMARLPKADTGPDRDPWMLLPSDWAAPAPIRSRRRQLVSTLETCIASAHRADAFPTFAAWCERLMDTLRDRWPEAAGETPFYPAFADNGVIDDCLG